MKGRWRKVRNVEISNFSSSCNTVMAIYLMRMRHAEREKKIGYVHEFLVGEPQRERPFVRQRYVFYANIEMNITEAV